MTKRIKHYRTKKLCITKTLGGLLSLTLLQSPIYAATLNIYGVGHVSADSVDDGEHNTVHATSSSSRFGLKGAEDLGNGTDVIYQYETGVDLTGQGINDGNGSSAVNDGQLFTRARPSFLGLRSDFGQILIGHTLGLDQWVNDQNYFADQIGDVGTFWANGVVGGRLDNVIQYTTPKMGDFDAILTLVPHEDDTNNSDVVTLKGNYVTDQFQLGLAFANAGTGQAIAGVDNEDASLYALTAGYDFEPFSIGGGLQNAYDIGGVDGNDREDSFIGFSYNVTANDKVKAQFAYSTGKINDTDANSFALGYDRKLSDQTTVYVAYAMVNNDDNINFVVNGKGHGDTVATAANGEDPSALSFGIVSTFDVGLIK